MSKRNIMAKSKMFDVSEKQAWWEYREFDLELRKRIETAISPTNRHIETTNNFVHNM